jgi:arsenate reductase-like glutaredoxin family protein
MITVYSKEGCKKCEILKEKLKEQDIDFSVVDDVEVMEKLGIDFLPVLDVHGDFINYGEAIRYLNKLRG